jgi:hypothetical protein
MGDPFGSAHAKGVKTGSLSHKAFAKIRSIEKGRNEKYIKIYPGDLFWSSMGVIDDRMRVLSREDAFFGHASGSGNP